MTNAVSPGINKVQCHLSRDAILTPAVEKNGFLYSAVFHQISVVNKNADDGRIRATAVSEMYRFKTSTHIPKTGVLVVGLGGNNGSTLVAGLIANRNKLLWQTQIGEQRANWLGSVAMCGTTKLGVNEHTLEDVYVPVRTLLPMVNPDDLIIGGWDISKADLPTAMRRAQVLPIDVQRLVAAEAHEIPVLPGVYCADFIATNQFVRADNTIEGTKLEQLHRLRANITQFKAKHDLEKVIVLWSGNTERFSDHTTGIHDTGSNLLTAIENDHSEIAPSLLYAVAAVLEGCCYINGSPQNTFCAGLVELAQEHGVYLAGDDLKTGQTKFKSVMADFLVSTALKPTSICSYNHLGNNDGLNLSSDKQFRSKEITKAGVVDDMISSNSILFPENEPKPDHLIVIRYVPSVGDSKRAMDEYTAKIFMNGTQTFVIHNTCEDSLLAVPIMLDLILFSELLDRVKIGHGDEGEFVKMHPLLSLLSLFLKAPQVPKRAPVINAFFSQREGLISFIRSAAGLPATDYATMSQRMNYKQ